MYLTRHIILATTELQRAKSVLMLYANSVSVIDIEMLTFCKIAESYWFLHTQHKSAFTQEIDLRPYVEKF